MKRLAAFALAAAMAIGSCTTAFAGSWQQDGMGYWYQNDDGGYLKDGWHWIDGKCYYFTEDGYCLINTQTPDGYQVDASGAWIVNGAVQTQQNTAPNVYPLGSLTVTAPNGYYLNSVTAESGVVFVNQADSVMIAVMPPQALDAEIGQTAVTFGETVLDIAVEQQFGTPTSKSKQQLADGQWMRYDYFQYIMEGTSEPMDMTLYMRVSPTNYEVQLVMFAGAITGLDLNVLMNECVR